MGHIDPCRAQLTTLSNVDKTYSDNQLEFSRTRSGQLTSSITWCLETELVRSLLSDSGYWVGGRRGRVGSVDACRRSVRSKRNRSVGDWTGYTISHRAYTRMSSYLPMANEGLIADVVARREPISSAKSMHPNRP